MPTPAQLGSDTGPGDNLGGIPEQNPERTQGGAPAGPWISEAELPSVAVPGGVPFTTGGYSPQADQDKLPPPGSSEGNGLAPSGVRK